MGGGGEEEREKRLRLRLKKREAMFDRRLKKKQSAAVEEEKKRTNMRVRTAFFCPSRGPFPSPCHALSTSTNLAPRLSNRGSSSAVARAKPAVDRGFPLAASSARGANAAESEGSRRAGGGGIGAVCCIDGLEER